MDTKKCSKCGQTLPISEFNWSNKSAGIRQSTCRECFRKYNRRRYLMKRGTIKENVSRYKTMYPDRILKTRLATNAKHPTKQNARKCVEAAITSGDLTRPSVCSGCGCSSKEHRIEAHHHDYSKTLSVIWLCTPCHRRMDAQRRKHEEQFPSKITEKRSRNGRGK